MILLLTDRAYLRRFYEESRDQGIVEASQQALRSLRVQVSVKGKISRSGPLLLIANHPCVYDNLTVWSIFQREDAFMFSWVGNRRLGPTYEQYSLPVYFSSRPVKSLLDWIRVPYWRYIEGGLTRKKARELNRAVIQRSAELLNAGHCVIIFPSGSDVTHSGKWKNGVGFLVQQVQNPDLQVQFLHITGSRWYDFFRYTPFFFLKFLFSERRITAYVSRLFRASQFKVSDDGRVITQRLQSQYEILKK